MFKCGFFNSVNGDRKYNAEEMNNPYFKIVSNGVFADDKHSDDLQVKEGSGLNIIVNKGTGLFFNKWAINDSDLILNVPEPPVANSRIDSVIIKIDISENVRNGTIEYRKGETLENPYPPILVETDSIKEYRLANVKVKANVTEITQADIEDTRPTNECGFITNLLQNSDITSTYKQWEAQFYKWFNDIKANLVNHTLILSLNNTYITENENEKNIKINIPAHTSELDILEVYINGLKLIENVDYIKTSFEEIELTLPVDKGTQIEFIVYKSIDNSEVENIKDILISMNNKIANLELKVNDIKNNTWYMKPDVISECSDFNDKEYLKAGTNLFLNISNALNKPEWIEGHECGYATLIKETGYNETEQLNFVKQTLMFSDNTANTLQIAIRGLLVNGNNEIQGNTGWHSSCHEADIANGDENGNPINTTYSKATNLENGTGTNSLQQKGCTAIGDFSLAGGSGCETFNGTSLAFGVNCKTQKYNSFALGYNCECDKEQSFALGEGVKVSSNKSAQVAVCKYNKIDENKAFIIGGGTSDSDRKNILTVGWEGKINTSYLWNAKEIISNVKKSFDLEDWEIFGKKGTDWINVQITPSMQVGDIVCIRGNVVNSNVTHALCFGQISYLNRETKIISTKENGLGTFFYKDTTAVQTMSAYNAGVEL